MSTSAIKASFTDYKLLQIRSDNHIPWTAIALSGSAANQNNNREPTIPKRQRTDTSSSTYSNIAKVNSVRIIKSSGVERYTRASSVTTAMEQTAHKQLIDLKSKTRTWKIRL
jgi:hypothetical protein